MLYKSSKSNFFIKPVAAIALIVSALMLPACNYGGERYEGREELEEREGLNERREGIDEEREGLNREEREEEDD